MRFKRFFFGAYVLPLFCFFCAYLLFFSFFACVFIFLLFFIIFFFLFFSSLGLDWVLLFFFWDFETSHWITVRKDFDKV